MRVVVAKFPQKPSGMTSEGQLVHVHDGSETRVTVRFPEVGTTGVRDTTVFTTRMLDLPEDADPTDGWMADPYDRSREDPLMRNGAEDETFDSQFPDHPLTLVRAELQRLQRTR